MLNAIYFNGYWRKPFPENETIESYFFTTPNNRLKTTFMMQTNRFYYLNSRTLNAQILRLPYKGQKFSMTIALPNENTSLEELVQQLSGSTLHYFQYQMDEFDVRVQLPKFKFGYSSNLNEILQGVSVGNVVFLRNELSFH